MGLSSFFHLPVSLHVTHCFKERVAGKEGEKLLGRAREGGSLVPHTEQVGVCEQGKVRGVSGGRGLTVPFLVLFQGECLCLGLGGLIRAGIWGGNLPLVLGAMLWEAGGAVVRAHPAGAELLTVLPRGAAPSPAGREWGLSWTLILWDAAGTRWRSQPFPFISLMGGQEAAAVLGSGMGPFLQIPPPASQPREFL